jgi:SurA N-terminal domain
VYRQIARSTAVLGAVLLTAVGLCACGGIPGYAVVQVDGSPITRTTFDHWMKIAAGSTKTTSTSRKLLQSKVLDYLISADWVIDEGSSLAIKLSDAEVKREFVKEKVAEFPQVAKFQAFLKSSGETVSDLLLSVKLRLLQQKIEQRAIKAKGSVTQAQVEAYYAKHKSQYGKQPLSKVQAAIKQQLAETQEQTAFTEFVKNFKKKWTAKTECRPGYVVADCKQYKAAKAQAR